MPLNLPYHHIENGFDDKLDYQTLEEAEAAAQGYVAGTMEEDGFAYLVFFKGRDVDVMTQAFKEFSAKTVKQKEKQSLKQKLSRSREQSKAQHKEKVKVKTKDRGVEL